MGGGTLSVGGAREHGPRARAAEALPRVSTVGSLADVRPVTVRPVPPDEQPAWDATVAAFSSGVELPRPTLRRTRALTSGPDARALF